MKRLSRHNRVVWVNYHGSRRPTVGAADIRAACTKLFEVARGVRRVSDTMVQVTPLVIPGARGGWLEALHRRLLIGGIRRAIRYFYRDRPAPVQVWSFAPDVPFLVGRFDEAKYLYYCVDEFAEFEGYDAETIMRLEREQIEKADLVVATSQKLHRTKQAIRDDVVYVPHGVDYDHFTSAWQEEPALPEDIRHLAGPVFGYFGLLHHWVDIELLREVAQLRPGYQFVLIGEVKVDLNGLDCLPNVHVLGRRAYADLPAYCAGFDAAMMLFRQNSMTENVNPIKMQEYLAAGLPIVSTPLPEADGFSPFVIMAKSADAFAAACDRVLVTWMRKDRATISETVRTNGWETRISRIEAALAGSSSGLGRVSRASTRAACHVGASAKGEGRGESCVASSGGSGRVRSEDSAVACESSDKARVLPPLGSAVSAEQSGPTYDENEGFHVANAALE